MKRTATLLGLFLVSSAHSILACQACFGNYNGVAGGPPQNVQHMAIAVWVMMFIVMSVLGGVGAFSFHLWRRGRMPIEPHERLAEEDLSQYA